MLGELDRDTKGEIIAPTRKDPTGKYFLDKKGQIVNQKGYLVTPASGDIVNNLDGKVMFSRSSLD